MREWLIPCGETGKLLATHDWAATPLGPLNEWPQSLRTVVNFMLEARQPVYIAWGAQLWSMYNDSYLPIVGDKHPNAMGQPFDVLWAEIWDEYRPHVEAVIAGQAQFWIDQPVMLSGRPDRPVGWFTFSWTPLRDESGTVVGLMCVGAENTERVLAERQLVESMDEGYCVIEIVFDANACPVDYRFVSTNPAFVQQTGLENANGKLVSELVPGFEQRWIDNYGNVALTGQPFRVIDEAPSMSRWFDVYAFRLAGGKNKVGALFRDITERKRAEQQLTEADQRKDEFLAMLAHELRNPLAPIGAAAALLRFASTNQERVRHASEVIGRQVSHMTALIDDLLDVSRVTRGLVALENSIIDVREVIDEAFEQVTPLVATRRQHLTCQMLPEPLLVDGDAKRLVQVLSNILNNASKYTADKGHIVVNATATNTNVIVEVRDDGIGMAPDLTYRVFDLFTQAERTSDRSAGGLGLGLALVKSLVELHHGVVVCSSPGLGKGSTFRVSLPRMYGVNPANAPDVGTAHSSTVRGMRLLVVDDNIDAAEMLALLLEADGHEVVVEHGSRAAIERAKLFCPQACLLDIGLPDIDGYELARRLRAIPGMEQAILVAVTGYGQQNDHDNAIAAGFDHHMVKPIDIAQLASILGSPSP
jgi:signal transduction histidine kinase